MNRSHRLTRFALATYSGCLWFLACTPFDWPGVAWIAAVPMLFAIDRAPTFKEALLLGWWAGVVETAGGFHWLIDTTQRFAGFPWIGGALVLLVFCATRALIFLLFTAIVIGIRRRRALPMALLGTLAMPACEFLVPQIFTCGQWISQAWHPLVIQIVELTGPLGVTALLMLANGAVYDVLFAARGARRPSPAVLSTAAVAVAVLAAALLFGTLRMRSVDAALAHAPRLSIGLVQPNFAYSVTGDFSRDEALRQLAALQGQSQRLERAGAQLIVWSEGAYPVALTRDFKQDFADDSEAMIRRGFTVPLMLGADSMQPDGTEAYNSAILLDAKGAAVGRYDKVHLLAFGEYIPWVDAFPWVRSLLPEGAGQFKAGDGPGIIDLTGPDGANWRLGPVICYEDLLPDLIRGVGRLHPDLLVNLTSDQWFGAPAEPMQHLALAVFSAVELRVALVRAVNSGPSALVDPNGRLSVVTYADDPYRQPRPADGVVVSAPKLPGGRTLYVAWGEWFAYTCLLALTALGLIVARQRAPALPGAADPAP